MRASSGSPRARRWRVPAWVRLVASLVLAGSSGELLAAEPAHAVVARIRALESLGRAKPAEAAEQLERLLGETREHSPERLELLTVKGLALADASQRDAALAVAARLDAWGSLAGEPASRDAATAALLVRASAEAHGGNNLQRADALLAAATRRLPSTMSPHDRYRFVAMDGYIKDHAGRLEEAVRLNHEAMALADRGEELWRQSEARTALAYSYYGAKQMERARRFSLEAIAIAEGALDWVALGRAQNTAGIVLDGLGDQEGERRSFDLAIEYAVRAGAKRDEVRYRANLADFFLQKSDYKTALAHAERALPLARELKDANSEMVALANMGLAHISMQRFDQGKRLVHEAIAIDERRGATTSVADTYRELGSYLEKAGDLRGAVSAYHVYRKLAAGISQKDQQQAILTIQEQYDADRRASSLALLQREQGIKNEQLRHRAQQQQLWWLLAAVFVVSFGIVALLYRRVRRTNGLLATSNERLQLLGEQDPLTGLSNRRHFQTLVQQFAVDGMIRGTVFLIDIDHFKNINDLYGHGVGDVVLQEVSERLRAILRDGDLIVRWGGEEFLVVVPSLASEQVDALAVRMLGAIHAVPVEVHPHRIVVSASIGFATFPIGPASLSVHWERALNLVDTAMYLAKAHGRNRAYGVKLKRAADDAAIAAITRSLEAAWQDGDVVLTLLRGRVEEEQGVAA
ncbi:MAG TPA: GGDEF domain-containing protein [Ideonella sp.]|nr:GGDEF domain-containing protein [Ideonella sp.]